MKEFYAIRNGTMFIPADDSDFEIMKSIKAGQPLKVQVRLQSARSLQHHRLFFALLSLTLEYWDEAGSLLSPAEVHSLNNFVAWIESQGGQTGAIERAKEIYLQELHERRSARIEPPKKSVESLLLWVKDKVGHVDLLMTPEGVKRVPRSINFNAMSQEEFNEFYKQAFSVCWRFVMSRHFNSEQEARDVVEKMVGMN